MNAQNGLLLSQAFGSKVVDHVLKVWVEVWARKRIIELFSPFPLKSKKFVTLYINLPLKDEVVLHTTAMGQTVNTEYLLEDSEEMRKKRYEQDLTNAENWLFKMLINALFAGEYKILRKNFDNGQPMIVNLFVLDKDRYNEICSVSLEECERLCSSTEQKIKNEYEVIRELEPTKDFE